MKYLIVNADDFGASRGINRGILEAQQRGILTSTSLLVRTPWSEEAAAASRATPALSVGLHVDLGKDLHQWLVTSNRSLEDELRAQLARFEDLMRRPPTHLDSHHNVHRHPRALPHFRQVASQYGLPLREHSPVRYFSRFYGQWGGETHLEQISAESLAHMLESEIEDGWTELSCHPGYVDPEYPTGYSDEREAELRTLCDPRIRQVLAGQSIKLVSYDDLCEFVVSTST